VENWPISASKIASCYRAARRRRSSKVELKPVPWKFVGSSGAVSLGVTPSRIPTRSTMSDVVLDANVLWGCLIRTIPCITSTELLAQMQGRGDQPVCLDVMVAEMVSALCRRAT